jgi:hypothetical protein
MVSAKNEKEMRRKETAGINYALNFLNNKLRIYVLSVEGFMTNLFFSHGAVSLRCGFSVRE